MIAREHTETEKLEEEAQRFASILAEMIMWNLNGNRSCSGASSHTLTLRATLHELKYPRLTFRPSEERITALLPRITQLLFDRYQILVDLHVLQVSVSARNTDKNGDSTSLRIHLDLFTLPVEQLPISRFYARLKAKQSRAVKPQPDFHRREADHHRQDSEHLSAIFILLKAWGLFQLLRPIGPTQNALTVKLIDARNALTAGNLEAAVEKTAIFLHSVLQATKDREPNMAKLIAWSNGSILRGSLQINALATRQLNQLLLMRNADSTQPIFSDLEQT